MFTPPTRHRYTPPAITHPTVHPGNIPSMLLDSLTARPQLTSTNPMNPTYYYVHQRT